MKFILQDIAPSDWSELDAKYDRTIAQTHAWMQFVAETQNATPVVARLYDEERPVGRFSGLIVRKLGFKVLGSPFPGWTTSYMGFNLEPGIDRGAAVESLREFAFRDLGCVHVELMDRHLDLSWVKARNLAHREFRGFEVDLRQPEDALLAGMAASCRRCIRKAEKSGVVVVAAKDDRFADDYYAQLTEVFGRQGLRPTYPRSRVQALIEHLAPTGRLLLLRALDERRRCLGTGIFPAMNDTMYFWGGASYRRYQGLRPNQAIQWYAMRYWKERGISRYDMGGGGDYKKQYGGIEIAVPWIRMSRNFIFPWLREAGRLAYSFKQRIRVRGTAHQD